MMVNEAYQFTASVSKDIYVNKLQTTAAIVSTSMEPISTLMESSRIMV